MRRFGFVASAAAVLCGAGGFFLRKTQLETVFDEVSGLAERMAPVSVALAALCAAFSAVCVIAVLGFMRGKAVQEKYEKAFSLNSLLPVGLYFALGLIGAVGGILYWLSAPKPMFGLPIVEAVFAVLALFSAIAVIVLAVRAFKGSAGVEMGLFSVIPPIFMCFWLVLTYRDNAANPVLLDFFYECLGYAAASLAFYFAAGFVYGKCKPRLTLITHLLGICFLTASIAAANDVSAVLISIAHVGALMLNTMAFCANVTKAPEPQTEE